MTPYAGYLNIPGVVPGPTTATLRILTSEAAHRPSLPTSVSGFLDLRKKEAATNERDTTTKKTAIVGFMPPYAGCLNPPGVVLGPDHPEGLERWARVSFFGARLWGR